MLVIGPEGLLDGGDRMSHAPHDVVRRLEVSAGFVLECVTLGEDAHRGLRPVSAGKVGGTHSDRVVHLVSWG